MAFLDFQENSIVVNLIIFAVASVVVWFIGVRMARYTDKIAVLSGLGQAFLGMVLLASATSLPEITTTIGAISVGNATLAVNNLYGSIVIQTAFLALADLMTGRRALTSFVPNAVLLLEAMILIVLLALSAVGMATGELITLGGVGLWTGILGVGYFVGIYMIYRYKSFTRWKPINTDGEVDEKPEGEEDASDEEGSLKKYILLFIGASVMVAVAGFTLALTADALAEQSGLGSSFIGATLLAFATGLPELSTTISAARMGKHSMALSNIFGSNALLILLLFLADILYRQGPILMQIDQSAVVSAGMGIAVTAVYVVGMLERDDKSFLRMGYSSWLVLALALGNSVLLYFLR